LVCFFCGLYQYSRLAIITKLIACHLLVIILPFFSLSVKENKRIWQKNWVFSVFSHFHKRNKAKRKEKCFQKIYCQDNLRIYIYICCKKRRRKIDFHLIFPGWAFVHIERENNIYFFEKTTEKPFPNTKKLNEMGRTLFFF